MLDNEILLFIRCFLEDIEYLSLNRRLLVLVDKIVMLERDLIEDLREERMDVCFLNFCCFFFLDLIFYRMARMMMIIRAVLNILVDIFIVMVRILFFGGFMYGFVIEKEI